MACKWRRARRMAYLTLLHAPMVGKCKGTGADKASGKRRVSRVPCLSVNLLLLLTLTHVSFPRARWRTRKFFELSYYDASSGLYVQGWDDFCLVSLWIVVFTGLRAAVMDYVLIPFARWGGIEKKKARIRFAEQAWLFLYYVMFWSLGMYILYNSDYWLNLRQMWANFPTRSMSGVLKWYYLVQFAFWLQQILVMFTHHIITCALILASYGYYQTKVGNVILCVMDVVDLVFPTAKMLKYLGYQTACDVAFGIFIVTWFTARHVFYLMICWSLYTDVGEMMPYGCYSSVTGEKLSSDGGSEIAKHVLQPFLDPDGTVCFNPQIRYSFLGLLLALQILTLIWFGMIMRVAYNVLSGKGADDSRSDDECAEDDAADEDPIDQLRFDKEADVRMHGYEEEVGVDQMDFGRKTSPVRQFSKGRKSGGRASGISIPGHGYSDRKELLGRIGCDKPS
ncbi:TLC domain-containing protein [Cryomyces antarcticus]